jgi:molybdopterin-guanine dinucleotide biosynthesis protein A
VDEITGLVLAGGQGRRMGGVDKGLQLFQGLPLALHALQRLRPQVQGLAINANRHLDDYKALGAPVWPDADDSYAGPLAGVQAGLAHCATPLLLTVPCDAPLFPLDLAARLLKALKDENADIAQVQGHPVFALLRVTDALCDSLKAFLAADQRKVEDWMSRHPKALVSFDDPKALIDPFSNLNTLDELQALDALHELHVKQAPH